MDLDSALSGKPAEGASAVEILRADHREVARLFSEYEGTRGAHPRKVLAHALCLELELHDLVERDVFYPALRERNPEAVEAALRDHDAIRRAVEELKRCADADQPCDEALMRLKALVEPHVREEEERLFALAEQMPGASLRELGAALIKRKEALTRSTEWFEGPAT